MTNLIKKYAIIFMIMFGFLPMPFVQAQSYDADEQININVYEKINPAIVSIDAQVEEGISSGTGCIINSDGTILTSSHVIEGSKDIDVTISSGKVFKAKVLSILGTNDDLALLKINSSEALSIVHLGKIGRAHV